MENFLYLIFIYPLILVIEFVFSFCHKIFDNTGVSILGISFAVSMLTLPLYIVAEGWQQLEREKQKQMEGGVKRIKKAFKGDEQYMVLSTFYRQHHYHPLMALRSSFGLLIQVPFFMAAYICLSNMQALKGNGFLFIKDMGAPDALFTIGSFGVNVLPIAMTLINIAGSAIYTRGFKLREKLPIYGMALIFLVLLYQSPSGLVLYWTMNNVFSLVKNVFYKLKNPAKKLYCIMCAAVTAMILFLFIGRVLSFKRAALVSAAFSLVYFVPLFVRLCNYLVDNVLSSMKENFSLRLLVFITGAASLSVLLGLYIPSILISSSPMEFSGLGKIGSPVFYVQNTFLKALGLCLVWPALVFFLYRRRFQSFLAGLSILALVVALVNVFLFPGNYGSLSRALVFTETGSVDPTLKSSAINFLVLLVTSLAVLLFFKLNLYKFLLPVFGAAAFSLLALSFVSNGKIKKGYDDFARLSQSGTLHGDFTPIFHFSKTGKNVLFVYLDRAQSFFVQPLFEECPELFSQYSGFTLYKNTVSFNGHTLIGAPPCFGGYDYTPIKMNERKNESLVQKNNEALTMLPRIFTEQGADYTAVVTDSPWANYSWIPDLSIYDGFPKIKAHLTEKKYLDRWLSENPQMNKPGVAENILKRNVLWYGIFRVAPLALRPAVYNTGFYWNPEDFSDDTDDYLACYSVIDYLPRLTDFESSSKNTYTCFVNNATHAGVLLQAPDYVPVKEVTRQGDSQFAWNDGYNSLAGAMKRLGTWFDYLKENGVYDNTRIVIAADHGYIGMEDGYEWGQKFEEVQPGRYHPLLMFKDFEGEGNLKVNSDFMTNADIPALLTSGLILDAKNPYNGNPVTMAEKQNGALVCTSDIFMPHHSASQNVFTAREDEWWLCKENIFESKNWIQQAVKNEK